MAKAKPQPKAKARSQTAPEVSPQAFEQTFAEVVAALKKADVVVQGDWALLKEFLKILGLPRRQTLRDYLTGPSSWRLGSGKGKLLKPNTDWAYKHGKRGGGRGKGHPHVKIGTLKEVLRKYYRNRQLQV